MEAVIFDMDGVIVKSEVHWKPASDEILNTILQSSGVKTRELMGMNVFEMYEKICEIENPDFTKEEFFEIYDEEAREIYRDKAEMVDGIRKVLKRLDNDGIKIGLASSSFRHWIDIVIDRFGLRTFFDAVVSFEDIDGRGKPCPDIYLHVASLLDVDSESCAVVEDSKHGVEAAKRAGMKCIGLDLRGDEQDLSEADKVVENSRKILEVVTDSGRNL